MKKQDKIYLLDQMLKAAKLPVSKETISERLNCSTATVYRIISDLRDGYGAPIETDIETGNIYYQNDNAFELPGLRLQSDEIEALLMANHLLEDIQTGLLKKPLSRLLENIGALLKEHGIEDRKNVQIIYALSRKADNRVFSEVFKSLQNNVRIEIIYAARSTNDTTTRVISPLKLTNYKNAWYLDSWCHLRDGIRSFALEQIEHCTILTDVCIEVTQEQLSEHFSGSYGIFSGPPTEVARLKVSPAMSSWVAKEQWHSKQKISFLRDGSLFLEIPYNQDMELIMDILRYGENITVLSPESLKNKVKNTIENMLSHY